MPPMNDPDITHSRGAYGGELAGAFRVRAAPVALSRSLHSGLLAATEVRDDAPERSISKPIPTENAYLATLHLARYEHHTAWEDGRQYPMTTLLPGDLLIRDLRRDPTVLVDQPHHELHFYIPCSALDSIADNCDARQIDGLQYAPGTPTRDAVVNSLGKSMLAAMALPDQASNLFLDHLLSAVATHLAVSAGGLAPRSRPLRGGLSKVQERRAKEMLSANLHGDLAISELAQACGLSTGHFNRAFQASTGLPPHRWLTRRRIEVAKAYMRETDQPLAVIALDSGFADQSHFTRVFSQAAGMAPSHWRATHKTTLSSDREQFDD